MPETLLRGGDEVSLGELISRRQTEPLSPPMARPDCLPFLELTPPVFERVVAEVVWLIDGMNTIRAYGRSGQEQGGLDLVGRRAGETHVYQVRRVKTFNPADLRKAVEDYAGRFVLATCWQDQDTAVEDELFALQREYLGDLDVELYDGRRLSPALQERPSIVAGVFGPAWAQAMCGVEPPGPSALPHGYALLNDPLEHMGLSEALRRAEQEAAAQPAAAAELVGQLVAELRKTAFPTHADQLTVRRRELLEAAGEPALAFDVSAGILLDRYESGERMLSELDRARDLAPGAGPTASRVHEVLTAVENWFMVGYDLDPVAEALADLIEADSPLAARLTLAVAEQVVVDEDPRDDIGRLESLAARANGLGSSPEHRVRLQCCLADFAVRNGATPQAAFQELERRALNGYIPERFAGLIHMRLGRALARADLGVDAIDAYRRAVMATTREGLAGDARDALRSISYLSDRFGFGLEASVRAMTAARTVGSGSGLIPPSFDPAVAALESLLDGKPRRALRETRHWLWHDRISGALTDELLARGRYGEVFVKMKRPDLAVRHLVLAGRSEDARAAASAVTAYVDIRGLLEAQAGWVCRAAAAAAEGQADLIPDGCVDAVANRLADLVINDSTSRHSAKGPAVEALGALAALGHRLPEGAARTVLPSLVESLDRTPDKYQHTDEPLRV
ncbi:hypothetical protein [Embleya sp. NPDC059259]|uniref:hypothetical protein n=1 Tax=unclassified Embleya TaxID=2699296 RepID=UPI00367A4D16